MAVWPEQFEVYCDGEVGATSLRLAPRIRRLAYERCNGRRRRRLLEPAEAEWSAFWQTIEEVGVWSWPRAYDPLILATDGVHWRVEIACQGRHVASSGYNVWPPGVFPAVSPEWAAFCGAVSRLAGGEPFCWIRWTPGGLDRIDPWRDA